MHRALAFTLALSPLILILVGIIYFRISGAWMAVIGWAYTAILAWAVFRTDPIVVLGSSATGIIKSFGVSVSVVFTMLMIFIMKECGALATVSDVMKRLGGGDKENEALMIGIGFGTLLTSLGVVTPAMFPPLLLMMGFTPFASVAIAVLGYNASTSFALLSIPITLPAEIGGLDASYFAYKVCLYLPVVSTLISFALLWMVGGRESIRKGFVPALLSGLVLGLSALFFTAFDLVPVAVIGVLSSALTIISLYIYQYAGKSSESGSEKRWAGVDWVRVLRAFSPWIILIALAAITNLSVVRGTLMSILGSAEVVHVYADVSVDLNVLVQVYTIILLSTLISIPLMGAGKEDIRRALRVWVRRIPQPFIAYSLYFAIAFIMFSSASIVQNGAVVKPSYFREYNMDVIIGATLASIFGAAYIYIAAFLGVFGAVVGGSETSSNVMFLKIQREGCASIGLSHDQFMTVFSAHAVGGGIASAITPSKINNAVVTINESTRMESEVLKNHLIVVLVITMIVGIMTALFIALGL